MSWELASFLILTAVLLGGFAWYERSRPSSQIVALVAALAALAVAGRVAFAALPNVVATTDVVVFAGFALGAAPGFAVGALAGLVSNFWLGQGPWTPWQMAGWGMCGVLGAGLAFLRPRSGRLALALFCGLAGLAYGALLNFSLMATYGGDLSLRRFLALESRGAPFDAAHAIGNAVIALLAGPAIVRMLVRFRERFEWRAPAVASALLLTVALASTLPDTARAADTGRAAVWLIAAQNADGGWGATRDRASAPDITAWAMLGLEAVGRNPRDVSRGGRDPVDYLRSHVGELKSPGDFARTILALKAAKVNPRAFGGRDLVAALVGLRRANGSFEGWPGSTAFAIMALRAGGATGDLGRTTSWLVRAQNADGGWGDLPEPPSTADGSGAGMQAIPDTRAADRALGYLRRHQRKGGGFASGSGGVNSQSTAWAVQGMIAVGADPSSIREGGKSALDYLAERQAPDGHYRYSASSDQTPVWVTAQALAAVAGKAFPLPPVSRTARSTPPPLSAETRGGSSSPPTTPPTGAGSAADLFESLGGAGAGSVPPASGAVPPTSPSTPGPGAGTAPTPPAGTLPEGDGAEPSPTRPPAPAFEASANPGPEPWAPLGIGVGAAGLALGGVLFFGRRFGW